MSAARLALSTGYMAYREEDQSADSDIFDSYEARLARYRLNMIYMENKQYSALNRVRYSLRYVKRYRHMRAIYNFISRLIDLEVNKTYGGRIDWAGDLKTGAIPIVLARNMNPILIECIKQILEWSNFGDGKDLYVRNGSTLGDSFLKSVTVMNEDGTGNKVYIEVLDPHKVRDFDLDERGNVKRIVIEYWKTDENGKDWLFREEIDKEWFRFYRNDEQYDSYENTYGYVPVTHTPHKHVVGGKKSGVTSFHNTLEKLDELNDGASVAKDGQRKATNPMLVMRGGSLGTPDPDLLERDGLYVFNLPKADMVLDTITVATDTAGAIATMEREDSEIQSDNPALSLQNMRKQGGELSGVAIENYYSDASDSLEAIQGRYDERLIRILQMALTMAGMMGLDGFPFDLGSYDRGEMRFYIRERKVFSDQIPMMERLRLILEASQSSAWPIIARELDVSEDDIALIEANKAEREAQQIAAGIRQAAQSAGMSVEEEEDVEDDVDPAAEIEVA